MITYILKSQGIFNIGHTQNLEKRLKTYKTHCPYFELVRIFEGDYEHILHRHFQKFRRGTEEWFFLTDEQVENIDISQFLERNYIEVENNEVRCIIQFIIQNKQRAIYCEKHNIKYTPLCETIIIESCCPEYNSLEDWLTANPEYNNCIEIELRNYRKLLSFKN